MPFATNEQLDAVVDYIKLSRQKGFSDEQIKQALLKSGRTEEQINYAFSNITKVV